MQRANYIILDGEIKTQAIEIQNKREAQSERNIELVKEMAEEFGCHPTQYYIDRRSNRIIALMFDKADKAPDSNIWRRSKYNFCGWLPKRNTKVGKALYKRIVGEDGTAELSSAIPEVDGFGARLSGGRMYSSTLDCLPWSNFDKEDVFFLTVPYDEMKTDEPENIPSEIMSQLKQIKSREMQEMYDEYNTLAEES